MEKHRFTQLCALVLFVMVIGTSCGLSSTPALTPTSAPTNSPLPSPTRTERPTSTPRPAETPDAVATESTRLETEMGTKVQEYYDAGYLPSADGEYIQLEDFSEDWAMIDSYRWWGFNVSASTFVMSGHFSWSSAIENPNPSGCGFAFDISENRAYAAFVTTSRIFFVDSQGHELGKMRGSGRLSLAFPAEADFTLIVNNNGHKAYAIVDDNLIGEYSINEDDIISGPVGYSILSGTNKDFGTHCEITNARVWVIKK
jgi:hypothetical protein